MEQLLKYGTQFNSHCKFLARVLTSKKKGSYDEAEAFRSQKRLTMFVAEEPMYLIKHIGPYFLKYGKIIQKRDWKSLLSMEFSEEVSDCSGDTSSVKDTIAFIKEVFEASTEQEKIKLGDVITDMLSVYCQYAMFVKNNDI